MWEKQEHPNPHGGSVRGGPSGLDLCVQVAGSDLVQNQEVPKQGMDQNVRAPLWPCLLCQ